MQRDDGSQPIIQYDGRPGFTMEELRAWATGGSGNLQASPQQPEKGELAGLNSGKEPPVHISTQTLNPASQTNSAATVTALEDVKS